jgi:hypothetical protein
MPLVSGRTPARAAALAAFLLHGVAVVWVRLAWGPGVRGGVVAWMDFPVSLAYGGLPEPGFFAASLLAGGALWAAAAAGLARLVGRVARGR